MQKIQIGCYANLKWSAMVMRQWENEKWGKTDTICPFMPCNVVAHREEKQQQQPQNHLTSCSQRFQLKEWASEQTAHLKPALNIFQRCQQQKQQSWIDFLCQSNICILSGGEWTLI